MVKKLVILYKLGGLLYFVVFYYQLSNHYIHSSNAERKLNKRKKLKAGRRDEVARYRGRGLSAQPLPINEVLMIL